MSDDFASLSDDDLTSMYRGMSDDDLIAAHGKAAPASDLGSMSDDDLTSMYRGMSDDDLKAAYGKPEAEGQLATFGREAAHGVVPAVGGFAGMGVGAGYGALGGSMVLPGVGTAVGAVVGGLAGMVGGSMVANKAQDVLMKDVVGYNDDAQRQANRDENYWSALGGEMAPALAAMSPVGVGGSLARQAAVRGTGAGISGVFEAGQEYLNEGHIDPKKVAVAAAAGAVLPATNRVGSALEGAGRRMVPGRPGKAANPAADAAHADVGDVTPEASELNVDAGTTTGNPQSAPGRSERQYGKDQPVAAGETTGTQGDIAPDIAAAVKDPHSPPGPEEFPADPLERKENPQGPRQDQAPLPDEAVGLGQAPADTPRRLQNNLPEGLFENPEAIARPKAAEPVVDAGFPQAGEPVAMGANDAAALPDSTPAKAAAAIAKSKAGMPEIKGETPVNKSITEGQTKAGNYPKARTHDFGKPAKIETHADDVRTGKGPDGTPWEHASPYDYGYFNKTKGADKDHIDFARPKEGSPEHGDKHFIIDQRNAETGKFDEHKVFTYYKDEAAARSHYEAGFGDGKGAQRLGAITEVDRPGLVKFLQKHTSRAATKPYGKFEEKVPVTATVTEPPKQFGTGVKPSEHVKIGEPKVITEARKMMAEQGLPEDAIKAFNELAPATRAAEATKFVNAKRSKTGVVKSAEVTRIRPKAAEVPGAEGITARSKADAARKGSALAQMKKAMDDHLPVEGEDHAALRARLEKIVATGGDAMKSYRPNEKPASYQLIRQAKQMLLRKTWKPEHVESFNATEKLLRSGKEGAADARATNRIEADVARSRRSGDDAVAHAEAEQAATRNTAEDDLIAAIDAKRGGKFDVPHEEAESMVTPTPIKSKADLPKKAARKTVDVHDSSLADIDTKPLDAAAVRKLEAAKLVGKKAAAPKGESEGAASEGKSIKVHDPEEVARINAMMNKAVERGKLAVSEEKARAAAAKEKETKKPSKLAQAMKEFGGDTSASLDIHKLAADLRAMMKTTDHTSSIAKTSKVPHSDYVRSVSNDLHTVGQLDKNHMVGNLKHAAELRSEFDKVFDPGRAGKSWMERRRSRSASDKLFADTMEKTYLAHEAGKLNILSAKERQFYDANLKPTFDEINALAQHIHALNPDAIDPSVANHIYRISKNEAHSIFKRKDDDPTRPDVHMNAISTTANTAKERKFVALERVADGKRFVISPSSKGFTLWNKYKAQGVKDPTFSFEAGKAYKAGSTDYIMRDAFTPEIEANARGDNGKPMQYFKNAALSAMMSHVQLASMARHLELLDKLRNDPEFKKLSAREGSDVSNENGWEKTKLDNFKGMTFDPHLRYVLDDYAKAGFNTPDIIRQMSQGVTKLLFWSPTAHIANVGVHWFVGRGWDWLKPTGYHSLVVDGMHAIKSVVTQDHLQTQLREHGAGTIYGGVVAKDFAQKAARTLAENIKREPGKWGPIADKVGLTAEQLYKGVYDNSSKIMWSVNDMFLTQRVLELQRKGKSMKAAIIEAERDIPNYRMPSTIVTEGKIGRFMQQMQADPAVFSFGRYHEGVFNSFANILKDGFGKDATIGDRVDAVGKMMAMAALAIFVYPLWDKAVKVISGNPDATAQRRGPMAVLGHLNEAREGQADLMKWARSTTTLPPATSTFLETLGNKDFRGKAITEPGDFSRAAHGDVRAAGRVVTSQVGHAAKGLVSPYSTISNADKKGFGPGRAVLDTLLDVKDPSAKGVKAQRMAPVVNERNARSRFKQGGEDIGERIWNKTVGYR